MGFPYYRSHARYLLELAKNSMFVRDFLAFGYLVRAVVSLDEVGNLVRLTRAYMLANHPVLLRLILSELNCNLRRSGRPRLFSELKLSRAKYRPWMGSDSPISRTLILKPPLPAGERGVIFSVFEYNWLKLLDSVDASFFETYDLVLATSWFPTDYTVLAEVLERTDRPIYIQSCNLLEREKLNAFHPRIRCLDSLPCDWLHPDYFDPKPFHDRSIDILVVSSWAPFKRHWHFFRILRDLPTSLKVVCVGLPDGNHQLLTLKKLADRFGVGDRIDFRERVPIDEVAALQCDSKSAAVFSLREGCCVAGAEALMAGAPLAMLADAYVGSAAYINERTGLLLKWGREAAQLLGLIEHGSGLTPRAWAVDNISCFRTTASLNELLKQEALKRGENWTEDLSPHHWRPFPTFFDEADQLRMEPAAKSLIQDYPGVFPGDWWLFKPR